jgi:hypothetical protein
MTDATLLVDGADGEDEITKSYRYRLVNRLLPRLVYSISGTSATHADRVLIRDFLRSLEDGQRRDGLIRDLEQAFGEELLTRNPKLGSSHAEAVARAGMWVDAPKPPSFEDVHQMIMGETLETGVPLEQLFPIGLWIQAYAAYRYQVRIFAFSEYLEIATAAAKAAMQRVLGISSDSFYATIQRARR